MDKFLVTGLNVFRFFYNGLTYADKNSYAREAFWLITAIWMLIILTDSLASAIRQNRSAMGMDGLLLFLADCCALLDMFLYFRLPDVAQALYFLRL
jgi:hypothetical protein